MTFTEKVHRECKWYYIIDIYLFLFTVRFNVDEKLIFRCQSTVSINVIYKLLISIFRKWIERESLWSWLPFEVEKIGLSCLFPCSKILFLRYFGFEIVLIICRLTNRFILLNVWLIINRKSTLHNFTYELWVVSIYRCELKMSQFTRLVVICWNFVIFFVCVLACLYELPSFLFTNVLMLYYFFRREFAQEFAQ